MSGEHHLHMTDEEWRALVRNWAEMLIKAISEDNTTDYKVVHRVLDAMRRFLINAEENHN